MMDRVVRSTFFQRFWDIAGAVSIRIKVLGIVVGVIIMLGTFVIVQMRSVLTDTLRHELYHQGEALADEYMSNINALVTNRDTASLQLYLDGWRAHYSTEGHNTIVDFVRVVNTSGEVLAQSPADISIPEPLPENLVQVITPLTEADAVIELGLAETNIHLTVREVTLQLLAIMAVMITVGFAAAFFLTWILTRPIYDLVTATLAVTRGDFSQRLPRWANDEIGQLTLAFNMMTDSLAQAEEERAEREALRAQYVSKVIIAQEEERQRISRELHDSTGQQLTSLLVGLKNLKEACGPAELEPHIEELRSVVSQTLEEVRHIAWQLRPSVLDDMGLISALERYVTDYQERYSITIDFLASGITTRLPAEMETSIYRIVQESLTNIVRHANATAVSIIIDRRGSSIRIIVEDNGVGFDPQLAKRSLGLQGIRERAALFDGTLMIEARPGKGTSLFVEIPHSPDEK